MFAVKDDVFVGYSNGRIVLIPSNNALSIPIKYLSEGSSILLCTILSDKNTLHNIFAMMDDNELDHQIQKLINELKPYLCDKQEEVRISFDKLEKSKSNTNIVKKSFFRLDYPVKLVVIPTWQCNRECAYCGVPKISPNYPETRIEPQLLLTRLLDAVENGVQGVVYHGGEPIFFYKELFEQIHELRRKNVQIQLSTKNFISKTIAYRLANVGLQQLQLSIDTIDPLLSKYLYNDETYAQRLAESTKNLLNAGIRVRVNIVLSKINYRGISDLLFYLSELNIPEVEISNYRCGSINDAQLELSKDEWAWLHHSMLKNQDKWDFQNLIYSPFGNTIPPAAQRPICESGRLCFLFLPNGNGCYCDFLSEKPEFCIGNLNEQSVGEIWEDSKLIDIAYPSKKLFENDKHCTNCNEFEYCVDRGFCFVKADGIYKSDKKCEECYLLED